MEAEKGGASASGAAKLISCHFGVWLVFLGHSMKVLTIILFVAVPSLAAWNVFSEMAYKHNMADLGTQLVRMEQQLAEQKRVHSEEIENWKILKNAITLQLDTAKKRISELETQLSGGQVFDPQNYRLNKN